MPYHPDKLLSLTGNLDFLGGGTAAESGQTSDQRRRREARLALDSLLFGTSSPNQNRVQLTPRRNRAMVKGDLSVVPVRWQSHAGLIRPF